MDPTTAMGFHRVAKHGKAYVKQDRYLGERYQDRNWYTSFLALVGTRLLFYPPKTKLTKIVDLRPNLIIDLSESWFIMQDSYKGRKLGTILIQLPNESRFILQVSNGRTLWDWYSKFKDSLTNHYNSTRADTYHPLTSLEKESLFGGFKVQDPLSLSLEKSPIAKAQYNSVRKPVHNFQDTCSVNRSAGAPDVFNTSNSGRINGTCDAVVKQIVAESLLLEDLSSSSSTLFDSVPIDQLPCERNIGVPYSTKLSDSEQSWECRSSRWLSPTNNAPVRGQEQKATHLVPCEHSPCELDEFSFATVGCKSVKKTKIDALSLSQNRCGEILPSIPTSSAISNSNSLASYSHKTSVTDIPKTEYFGKQPMEWSQNSDDNADFNSCHYSRSSNGFSGEFEPTLSRSLTMLSSSTNNNKGHLQASLLTDLQKEVVLRKSSPCLNENRSATRPMTELEKVLAIRRLQYDD